MNKTNKSFRKFLEAEYNRLLEKSNNDFYNFCKQKMDSYKLYFITTVDPTALAIEYPALAEEYNDLLRKFKIQNFEEEEYRKDVYAIFHSYEEKTPFLMFPTLIELLDKALLSNSQKAEVLAYFISRNISAIVSFNYAANKDNIQSFINHYDITKVITDINADMFINRNQERLDVNQSIRQVINTSGNIIPNINAKDHLLDLKALCFGADISYVQLITDESERKGKALQEKQQIQNEINANKTHTKTTPSFEEQRRACKDQKLAAQELKKYIVDGIPTRYLTSEDLQEMNKAFAVLNYSDEQIAKIQKDIVNSNKVYEEAALKEKYHQAMILILPSAEIELINQVEKVINDENALRSISFEIMATTYQSLKNKIISYYDKYSSTSDFDVDERELDCIEILCDIEELTTAFENYKLSDYRFTPKRKKDDTNE